MLPTTSWLGGICSGSFGIFRIGFFALVRLFAVVLVVVLVVVFVVVVVGNTVVFGGLVNLAFIVF